jgi:hypothetical protein
MKAPLVAVLFAVAAHLVFAGADASVDPTKIAEYRHAQSGERFELFQEPDGSLFCMVEDANGILSREEIPGEANRACWSENVLKSIARSRQARNEAHADPAVQSNGPKRGTSIGLILLLTLSERGTS